MILVDTSVWSIAFRRAAASRSPAEAALYSRMQHLMFLNEAVLIGPIRQELLSGVRTPLQFAQLQNAMNGFTVLALRLSTFDLAADCFNHCRSNGITPGDIDMMICASSIEHRIPILTRDTDFTRYAKHLAITLT